MPETTWKYEIFVISGKPYAEKVFGAVFYLDKKEAIERCDELNSAFGFKVAKVYKATLEVEKEPIYDARTGNVGQESS